MELLEIKESNTIKTIMRACAQSFYDQSVNSEERIQQLSKKFSDSACFVCAQDEGKIIGFTAFYCNDFTDKIAFLSMIIIKDEFQNRGLGNVMLIDCMNRCKEKNMDVLRLSVDCNNRRAIKFYEKKGFVQVRTNENSFLMEIKL